LKNVSAEVVLTALLEEGSVDIDLGHSSENGMVIATTQELLNKRMFTHVYEVGDLVDRMWKYEPKRVVDIDPRRCAAPSGEALCQEQALPPAGVSEDAGESQALFDDLRQPWWVIKPVTKQEMIGKLVRMVTEIVDQESWVEGGGEGTCTAYASTLVIKQTQKNHRVVCALLSQLRQRGKFPVPKAAPKPAPKLAEEK
jgi:hypothetical protein